MISAFGARAQAFAAGLGDLDAVIADATAMGPAYLEAVRRRESGEPFYGMVLFEEPRAQTTLNYAAPVVAQVAGSDAQRAALEQLGDGRLLLGTQPAAALWTVPAPTKQIVNEFLSLANATLVRSYAEANRLNALSARPRTIEPLVSEPRLPDAVPQRGGPPRVVIWAPDRAPAYVAWHAFALAGCAFDVVCVTADGDVPAELLRSAQCVVCPDPDDPGAAVAFARLGYGVAAPLASGAHEYVRDVASYPFVHPRDLQIAVERALANPASVRTVPRTQPAPTAPALPAELPLVSVAIFTYNRPADLALCLRDLAQQTYPRLEIVVFNDAGENVDRVVASYPNARVFNAPANGGVERMVVKAFETVKGDYVQLLADDDTLYPDHVERVMAAMLRSGASVGHANTLMRYDQRGADGTLTTVGYNALAFNDSTTATEALVATPIAGQSLIVRRDVIAPSGGYSLETALADQEFQLRLAARHVFAYADALTNEWRIRGGGENFSARTDGGAELRKLYEQLHPLPARPIVEQHRQAALAGMAARPKGYIFEPTVRLKRPAGT